MVVVDALGTQMVDRSITKKQPLTIDQGLFT